MANKVAFFDVDGTLTTERVWRGMLEYFRKRKLRAWTRRVFSAYHIPIYLLYRMGLINQSSFRKPWAAHLAWFIQGYTVEEAQKVWDWVARDYLKPYWRTDALELIRKHKSVGDLVVLVSAGLTPLEEAIAKVVGADKAVGTEPEMQNGRYTGGISSEVCLDENKALLAQKKLRDEGVEYDLAASAAYADSGTDIHLLEMVGHPVAFHPDDELRPTALQRGWQILE